MTLGFLRIWGIIILLTFKLTSLIKSASGSKTPLCLSCSVLGGVKGLICSNIMQLSEAKIQVLFHLSTELQFVFLLHFFSLRLRTWGCLFLLECSFSAHGDVKLTGLRTVTQSFYFLFFYSIPTCFLQVIFFLMVVQTIHKTVPNTLLFSVIHPLMLVWHPKHLFNLIWCHRSKRVNGHEQEGKY